MVATAVAVLAVLGVVVLCAQSQDKDKYSLVSPGGIAFSDFKGYEDWADVPSARTTEIFKVIVANPKMINASARTTIQETTTLRRHLRAFNAG